MPPNEYVSIFGQLEWGNCERFREQAPLRPWYQQREKACRLDLPSFEDEISTRASCSRKNEKHGVTIRTARTDYRNRDLLTPYHRMPAEA